MLALKDFAGIIHPALAVAVIFPLIGMVSYFALQTRQRRLATQSGSKSKIAPSVGSEHLKIGRWLANGVVILALIGLAHPIFTKMADNEAWRSDGVKVAFPILMFGLTIASLALLNRARTKLWRGIFATLTGLGLSILSYLEVFLDLGSPVVFRREFEWYVSHYHYGMLAAMLMIFSLAIFPDIYQDRTQGWRNVHIALNAIALLLFIGQGFTGTRDMLEIPLDWQKPYIEQLYIQNCQSRDCVVQPAPETAPAPDAAPAP